MKLFLKQGAFSGLNTYDVYDEKKNVVYTIKSQIAWGQELQVHTPEGKHLATLKEIKFSVMPTFEIYVKEEMIGRIIKDVTLIKPSFKLKPFGFKAKGELLDWNYVIKTKHEIIATVKQVFATEDMYRLNIVKEDYEVIALLFVLAIDIHRGEKEQDIDV